MTREEILALPADRLPEVSARMMGGKDLMFWFPTEFHDHARKVADWVCARLNPESIENSRWRIGDALDEITGHDISALFWAWTPEQLTRAALLAFVDAGGEI